MNDMINYLLSLNKNFFEPNMRGCFEIITERLVSGEITESQFAEFLHKYCYFLEEMVEMCGEEKIDLTNVTNIFKGKNDD